MYSCPQCSASNFSLNRFPDLIQCNNCLKVYNFTETIKGIFAELGYFAIYRENGLFQVMESQQTKSFICTAKFYFEFGKGGGIHFDFYNYDSINPVIASLKVIKESFSDIKVALSRGDEKFNTCPICGKKIKNTLKCGGKDFHYSISQDIALASTILAAAKKAEADSLKVESVTYSYVSVIHEKNHYRCEFRSNADKNILAISAELAELLPTLEEDLQLLTKTTDGQPRQIMFLNM